MLNYKTYLDKIYGCFLGKTVVGTLGAPYEGIKMPQTIEFKPEMINTMLPNDDLDLQVLWLDVCEKYGKDFTSYDLLERFVTHCDYSPGEYAVMRKNFMRGIYPPLSGKFSNDFYVDGMGCPIRSEIWGCLFPCQPKTAADYSERDGILDHAGDSVYAERFFAALESAAFTESDLGKLIDTGLSVIPADCKIRKVITDTLGWCRQYTDIKQVLRKILFNYGHPDCTNLYQNIGITVAALLLGNLDLIKTGMDALNCGFDTDCTCATAGAVIGVIRGANSLIKEYDLPDIKFVLGVQSDRRSDSVFDLSEDIAKLGCCFNPGFISDSPAVNYQFESKFPLEFSVIYENDDPTIKIGGSRRVNLCVKNRSDKQISAEIFVDGLGTSQKFTTRTEPRAIIFFELEFSVPSDAEIINETNLICVDCRTDSGNTSWKFGLVGMTPWKAVGPIWKTDPECTTEELMKVPNYWHLFSKVNYSGDPNDVVRRFHLNFAIDTDTEYLNEADIKEMPFDSPENKYEVTIFDQKQDSFRISDICGFRGPCVIYLLRTLISPEDTEVCVQLGHSSPVALFINSEKISERKNCDTWDAENIHLQKIKLKKGENTVMLRLTQVNDDSKFNLIFSKGPACAEHFVCFGSKNPLI